MKAIYYTLIFLLAASSRAQAQSKIAELKQKSSAMLQMLRQKAPGLQRQKPGRKINPYWDNIDAPHFRNSYSPQVKVPTKDAVWTHIGFDSLGNDTKWFLRSADAGKTWRLDTIPSPAGYMIGSISPIDGNVCYASMHNDAAINGYGGGVFKTTDGGATWKKLTIADLSQDSTYVDFVYFFDARRGLVVGDGKGEDSAYIRIYTTSDAGKTWQRGPDKNIPPLAGTAFSQAFNAYATFKNTIWFRAADSKNNFYLYRSDDLGNHWQLFNSYAYIGDFAFSDALNGLATSFDENFNFYLAATQDGGKTYHRINYTGTVNFFIASIPHTHVFVSSFGGSSYSTDYGATWKTIDTDETAEHTNLDFLNASVGWSGEGFDPAPDGGMYKWKLHLPSDINSAVANKEENSKIISSKDFATAVSARLYPNPVRNALIVEGLNTSAKTTLSLFSSAGLLIQQVTTTNARSSFNTGTLPAGNYYIKIQSRNQNLTLGFVKE